MDQSPWNPSIDSENGDVDIFGDTITATETIPAVPNAIVDEDDEFSEAGTGISAESGNIHMAGKVIGESNVLSRL